MSIYFLVIFVVVSLLLIIKDPFWGLISYLASVFLRFQEYVPQLTGVSIPMYIMLFTFGVAVLRGNFHDLKIDKKSILLFLYFIGIIGIPLIQGHFNEKHVELIGRGLFTFMTFSLLTNTFKLKVFFQSLFFLLLFLGIMLFHAYYVGSNYYYYWHHERPFGSGFLENPNAIVIWLNFGFIISAFLFFSLKGFYSKALCAISSVFFIFGIMLCNSRSGILEFFVASILLFLSIGKRKKIVLLVLVSILTIFVAQRAGSRFWCRMDTITGKEDSGQYEGSAQERLNSWKNGIEIFKKHPFVGVGAFNITKHNFRVVHDGTLEGRSLHQGYIEVFAENGILGGFLWLLLIIQSIRDLFTIRFLKKSEADLADIALISKTMLCCLGAFAVYNIFGSGQYSTFLFMLFGISSAIRSVIDTQISLKSAGRLN